MRVCECKYPNIVAEHNKEPYCTICGQWHLPQYGSRLVSKPADNQKLLDTILNADPSIQRLKRRGRIV